ncbi:histidine kinase [Rhodocytophaga aerolata]|uniref:Histidine kinase n=1 Tax=Rhodocytophaga aerolata TaxID=455078 RepID=A0ABT8RA54_9BACT|nr:histidine kinase [Rhodocytophaga aerolata]MDO1448133.1 histidine kinase [Rhodocytophaga aerolata]
MQEKLNDRKLLLYGPPIHFVAITIFFNIAPLLEKDIQPLRFIIFGYGTILITWLVARLMVRKTRKYYSGIETYKKRIVALIILSIPAVLLLLALRVVLLIYWVYSDVEGFEMLAKDVYFMLGINLFHLVVIISIYESRYFFSQWLIAKSQTEELLRINLEAQLDSLKTQVQPHFLFNSLNTLQALVKTEENKKAIQFINDLSQVYRYLLQSNESQLTSLEKELAFTHAYFNLLKTRFGNGLQMEIQVNPEYRQYLLPPVTLQLLVENAVKHNIASASKPLTIQVVSNHESIVVKNNLQRKQRHTIPSSKKGLLNITSKYRLLKAPEVQINERQDTFEVVIPLLKPVIRESINH